MEQTIQKFIDFKLEILNEILSKGNEGVFESIVFKRLCSGMENAYNFKEDLTPNKLIDSLMMDGDIIKVCITEYTECKYIASEHYLNKKNQKSI